MNNYMNDGKLLCELLYDVLDDLLDYLLDNLLLLQIDKKFDEYQPSGEGGAR